MRLNMAGHARRARTTMRSRVQLIKNGAPVWVCKAKITPTPRDSRVVEQAGQAVTLRTYDVDLPLDTPAPSGVGWDLWVLADPDDRLVGLVLDVVDQPLGDQGTVRLVCRTSSN